MTSVVLTALNIRGVRQGSLLQVSAVIFRVVVAATMLGHSFWGKLVIAGGPAIVITYLMVTIAFLILRRRDPHMDRPMHVGRRGHPTGMIVGVVAVVATAAMLALYLPGLPAFLDPEPWVLFFLWWILGIGLVLRIPAGVRPGPQAEEELLAAVEARRSRR